MDQEGRIRREGIWEKGKEGEEGEREGGRREREGEGGREGEEGRTVLEREESGRRDKKEV